MSADPTRAGPARRHGGALLRWLRASRLLALVSACLMLLQVAATADHLAASALAAVSGDWEAGSAGFLDFCRAPAPGGQARDDGSAPRPASPCPACALASAAAGGIAAAPPSVLLPASFALAPALPPALDLTSPRPWRHPGITRGPPRA